MKGLDEISRNSNLEKNRKSREGKIQKEKEEKISEEGGQEN